ncbi:MAG: alpha/beta hydrolase [Solirubrobacteraceae bacterium]|nr:alpha/beta hydrolase [Solirubrobacteraceae bacterium]
MDPDGDGAVPKRLLFIHGAGGFVEDGPLAAALAAGVDAELVMPEFSDDDMSVAGWTAPILELLGTLERGDLVVAHSFGANMLLHALAAPGAPAVPTALLLGMPDWGPEGWQSADYATPEPEPAAAITLAHCRDDDVVPFEHLALNAARLPSARVVEFDAGGHQFEGLAAPLVAEFGAP